MGWRAGLGLSVVGLLVLAGCEAPTRPERGSPVESATFEAVVGDDGVVSVRLGVEFLPGGGTLTLRAGTLMSVDEVTLNGAPRPVSLDGSTAEVPVEVSRAEVAFRLRGAVERYEDVAVVTLPVWSAAPGSKTVDPLVPVTGRVALPAPPVGRSRWHGSVPVSDPVADGAGVRLSGNVAPERDATVVITIPSGAVGGLPVLPGGPRRDYVEERQAVLDRADAGAVADRRAEQRRVDVVAGLYWVLVAVEVIAPLAVAAVRLGRATRKRLEARQGVPDYLPEPPGDDPPALVALVANGGHDIGREAVAATVLDLAHRGAVRLDGVGESFVLRVAPEPAPAGAGPTGEVLLDALRASAGAGGEITGPALGIGGGPWWRDFRRATLAQAKEAGLLQRRLPSAVFIVAVFALFITTFPLFARSAGAGFLGFLVAAVFAALPFVGGYVLSPEGERERARWDAFARWVRDSSEIASAPPQAVAVWGPFLSYGAAVGGAEAAVRGLQP